MPPCSVRTESKKTEASGDASLREMRNEFAEKRWKFNAVCAGAELGSENLPLGGEGFKNKVRRC